MADGETRGPGAPGLQVDRLAVAGNAKRSWGTVSMTRCMKCDAKRDLNSVDSALPAWHSQINGRILGRDCLC